MKFFISEDGNKKAKIVISETSLHEYVDLCTMRNGFQWSCFQINADMIPLIEDVLNKYKRHLALNDKLDEYPGFAEL